jgi:DNA replicative helicase MCM subunit Mcm2 (Cdc46/Mcm family)
MCDGVKLFLFGKTLSKEKSILKSNINIFKSSINNKLKEKIKSLLKEYSPITILSKSINKNIL